MTAPIIFQFDHPKDITVGQARVIYDDGELFSTPAGWRLIGGGLTEFHHEACAYAVRMDHYLNQATLTRVQA